MKNTKPPLPGHFTALGGQRALKPLLTTFAMASFSTQAGVPGESLRIALVSDTHTKRVGEDQETFQANLARVVSEVNAESVSLVLFGGDASDGGAPENVEQFKRESAGFNAPLLMVPGNHDIGNKTAPGVRNPVNAGRLEDYEQAFGPSFFVSEQPGVRVVGLNTSILNSGLPREEEQWSFMEEALGGPAARPTLVLLHYPPFLEDPEEPGGSYWNIEPEPRQRLLRLIQGAGVRAVLSGHIHYPLTSRHHSILYVTAPSVAFGLPKDTQPEGWVLLTVSTRGEVEAEVRYVTEKRPI